MTETVALGERVPEGRRPDQACSSTRMELSRRVRRLLDAVRNASGEPEEVRAQVEELARAVGGFVELSVPTDLRVESLTLAELAHRLAAELAPQLAARGASVEVEVAAPDTSTAGDRRKLEVCLAQLGRRALEALPASGGRLSLRAGADPGQRYLEIVDASDDASFGPLRGADERALWMEIAEAHEGTLELVDEEGSAFRARLTLPC
jgi:signal transduction histidine kinase